jgi:hypothetical protein
MARLKDLLTVEEVAERLKFDLDTVNYLLDSQEIYWDVYFMQRRVHIEDLEEFIENYDLIPDDERSDTREYYSYLLENYSGDKESQQFSVLRQFLS